MRPGSLGDRALALLAKHEATCAELATSLGTTLKTVEVMMLRLFNAQPPLVCRYKKNGVYVYAPSPKTDDVDLWALLTQLPRPADPAPPKHLKHLIRQHRLRG